MTKNPTDVRVMMEAMLDHQINGRTSRFYEKYLQVFAALPLIRAAALEEAVKAAEECFEYAGEVGMRKRLAAAIRLLKEQP